MSHRTTSRTIEPLEPRLLMAVIAVLNSNDSGAGSLRQAIAEAVSGDTIDLSGRERMTITLASPITIDKDLRLAGPALSAAISAAGSGRIFNVTAGATVSISDLFLVRGDAGADGGGAIYNAGSLTLTRVVFRDNVATRLGGAVYNDHGTLNVVDCTFERNVARGAGSAFLGGGGIYSMQGTVTVYSSTFNDNAADGGAGAAGETRVAYGGAIMAEGGTVALTNSTFSENISRGGSDAAGFGSPGFGGAVGLVTGAVSTFTHCTFVANVIERGAGKFQSSTPIVGAAIYGYEAGTVTVTNNVLTYWCTGASTNSSYSQIDGYATTVSSGGGNVIDGAAVPGITHGVNGDRYATVHLQNLALNAGVTLTHLPNSASEVHAGVAAPGLPALDQRGLPRTGVPHAGAVQWQPPTPGYGGAVRLNGDGDFVRIPHTALLQQQQFTVLLSVKLDADPADYNPLYSYGQAGVSEAVLLAYRADTEQLVVRLRRADGTDLVNYAVSVPRERMAGQWVNVAMRWMGVTADLYLDGEPIGGSETRPAESIGYGAADEAWIGSAFGQQSLAGEIDDVIVTNTDVDPADLLYRQFVYEEIPDFVAGYWRFNESTGPYVREDSGNGLYGELRGQRVASTLPLRIFVDEDSYPIGPQFLPTSGEWTSFGPNPAIVSPPAHGTATLGWVYPSMSTSVQYQPARDVNGTDTFEYSVTDGVHTTTATVLVLIRAQPDPPTFITTALPPASLGVPYNHTIQASDVDGDALTIVARSLPSWMTLVDHGDGTATISGVPTNAALTSYVITLRVQDGGWFWPQDSFTLSVLIPPTFTSANPPATAYFDTTYSHTVHASDANGDPLAITATGLPSWLTLIDHGDGTATLSGMPVDSLASSHAITLRVSDGEHVIEQPFVLSVPMEPFRMDDKGTVIVTGTVGRDSIQVWVREDQVRAVLNGVIRNFPLSAVTALSVYGLDEDDMISVNMRWIPAYVLGGGGNDRVVGGDERDFFIGGGGHDRLNGAGGDDRLSGLGNNDYLEGGSGHDHLTGGDGHDVLVGNSGNDRLCGDAGNDILYGKDRTYDILHGGEGDDTGTYDLNDLLHDALATPA